MAFLKSEKGKAGLLRNIMASWRPRNSGDSNDAHDTDSGRRQQIDESGGGGGGGGGCLLHTKSQPSRGRLRLSSVSKVVET